MTITVRDLQKFLDVGADGIPGKNTMKAVDSLLRSIKISGSSENWTDSRRLDAARQELLRVSGYDPGPIDGLIGEQTRQAMREFEAAVSKGTAKGEQTWRDEKEEGPVSQHRETWPRQSGVQGFFGAVGTNQVKCEMPFPLRLAWDPTEKLTSFQCHQKVEAPMKRIFQRTFTHYGHEKIKQLRLDLFGGCLNVRKMRGGSAWSMHSWGIAVDIDPDRNQLKWGRDKASLDDAVYAKFWEFVYDEGAISLGRERNYDWMHFQFARL